MLLLETFKTFGIIAVFFVIFLAIAHYIAPIATKYVNTFYYPNVVIIVWKGSKILGLAKFKESLPYFDIVPSIEKASVFVGTDRFFERDFTWLQNKANKAGYRLTTELYSGSDNETH